jgi:hypothetical protein
LGVRDNVMGQDVTTRGHLRVNQVEVEVIIELLRVEEDEVKGPLESTKDFERIPLPHFDDFSEAHVSGVPPRLRHEIGVDFDCDESAPAPPQSHPHPDGQIAVRCAYLDTPTQAVVHDEIVQVLSVHPGHVPLPLYAVDLVQVGLDGGVVGQARSSP